MAEPTKIAPSFRGTFTYYRTYKNSFKMKDGTSVIKDVHRNMIFKTGARQDRTVNATINMLPHKGDKFEAITKDYSEVIIEQLKPLLSSIKQVTKDGEPLSRNRKNTKSGINRQLKKQGHRRAEMLDKLGNVKFIRKMGNRISFFDEQEKVLFTFKF